MADPFAAHPELRPLIRDPSQSVFRNYYAVSKGKDVPNPAPTVPKMRSAEAREASRRVTLAGHMGDLWVFAYGSLMWDPAMDFAEVRRAWLPAHARRFILCDIYGARGTNEVPGPDGGAGPGRRVPRVGVPRPGRKCRGRDE